MKTIHVIVINLAGQTHIYFVGAGSKDEAVKSPFVERLLKKGYEVLYLVEPIDEYCIQSLPEFDGKKFQNVAKEGLEIDSGEDAKKKNEEMAKDLEPLLNYLKEDALKVSLLMTSALRFYKPRLIDDALVPNVSAVVGIVRACEGYSSNDVHNARTIRKQVTRGHHIVADGWAGAANPHPHPTPFPTQKHSQKASNRTFFHFLTRAH